MAEKSDTQGMLREFGEALRKAESPAATLRISVSSGSPDGWGVDVSVYNSHRVLYNPSLTADDVIALIKGVLELVGEGRAPDAPC